MAIRYEKQDHIVTITIDRYERRNAIDPEHSDALIKCWHDFRDDPDAWVAIITGVRNVFCAGADLSSMGTAAKEMNTTGTSETLDRMMNSDGGGARFSLKNIDIYKPIIAAVNGYAIAGGAELVTGTDIRIASEDATFALNETRRGQFAAGGTTARLPRQMGWSAAMELLLVGNTISAQRAFQMGLVNEVVPREALMDTAMRWAREITKNSPIAVQATKKSAMLSMSGGTLAEAYRIEDECGRGVYMSEDSQEGVRAFFEKRDPVWKAR